MHATRHELERMRQARHKLAQARQRVRRLSWLARDPDSLDAEVPLLSRAAFLRALARFQAIRLRQEQAALLVLRLSPMPSELRRAAAMLLLEQTRNCDTLGCADDYTFMVLLKGADDAGAQAVARRLHVELRTLTASMGMLAQVHTQAFPLAPDMDSPRVMELLEETTMPATASTTADSGGMADSGGGPATH